MDSFRSYMLRKAYQNVAKNGDKLAEVEPLIDWNAFTSIIQPMYSNQSPMGGRPNTDPVIMVKLLVLQQWYGLSDPELERQVDDRLSFQRFLGFPRRPPTTRRCGGSGNVSRRPVRTRRCGLSCSAS